MTDRDAFRAITIVKLTKTCHAYPSQWEGRCDNGQDIYIRYRNARFSIGLGWDKDEAVENVVYKTTDDDSSSGFIPSSQLRLWLPDWLTLSPDCTMDDPYGDMPKAVWRRDVLGYTDDSR